jgi:carboxypeptidase Taq
MTQSPLSPEAALLTLKERLREVASLRAVRSLLYWDQTTYLPERASDSRSEQLALIDKIQHERATSDEIGSLLHTALPLLKTLHPDSDEARLLAVAAEDYARNTKVPASFLAKFSAASSLAFDAWKKAREANEFSLAEPHLEKVLELSREYATYLRDSTPPAEGVTETEAMMDALIETVDPGFSVAKLGPLFTELRLKLVPLFDEVVRSQPFDNACVRQDFDVDKQFQFGKTVVRAFGYDFERGRQDLAPHPFMIRLGSSDVRITTRVKEGDLTEALFSTIHEAGHALYELGVDDALLGGPLGRGASSGVHESQSRLWENIVARGIPFWEHFYPQLQSLFPTQLGKVPLKIFHRAINRVERSLIRADADELSYNLHVMIRFDLELELLAGKLRVKDLPEAWNERYRQDLGIVPSHLSEGVLQDPHWFTGQIGGRFQGYTIGNVLSAQLYATALKAMPDLETKIADGEFHYLREWLRDNLHRHGRKFQGDDLITRATGKPLSASDYVAYLDQKYRDLIATGAS